MFFEIWKKREIRILEHLRARGLGAAAPPAIIFRAKANFFGQKPTGKTEKEIFLYLLNENQTVNDGVAHSKI